MPRLKDILKGIRCDYAEDYSRLDVVYITDDSRKVKKGDLFIALRGRDTDGYKFIPQAIANGAAFVLCDRDFNAPENVKKIIVKNARSSLPIIAGNFYKHPSEKLKMIGVTGTNGKTTITYLLENIIKAAKKKSGVIGTISYRINGREQKANNTTPGSLELQSLLSQMAKSRTRYAVMEVSSHSLDQGRVAGLYFDAAIFTNLTKEHLDYHKTMKRYFAAKAKLFRKLKKGGTAIINNDDSMAAALKRMAKGSVITYGIKKSSDVTAKNISMSIDSSDFTIKARNRTFDVSTRLIGRHNIYNILASAAAAMSLGIKTDAIKRGIGSFRFVPGRLEPVDTSAPFRIFVDYAHTEDALFNVLSLLKDVMKKGRLITVFGCGGNRDRSKRPFMGNVACSFSDNVIVTSDNPRFEDPRSILSEIEDGIKGRFTNYSIIPDRKSAIFNALKLASDDDVVIIAGKGHEKYQIIKDMKMPFDDCEVVKGFLS
jgi:UDP-N-acetylmuramyl-tripeptide synthetase